MGKSKGRKFRNWVLSNVKLKCFITQSAVSDAHAVHLAIERDRDLELRRLDSFASIVKAWESFCQAKAALADFKCSPAQSNDEITQNFIRAIHDTFGEIPNDDAIYQMSGDKEAGLKWLSQGNNAFVDEPPPGVCIEVINPPVQKNYKVLAVDREIMKNVPNKPKYDGEVFTVAKNAKEPLLVEDTLPVYSSYVSAAYVADHVNSNNRDSLTKEELLQLLYESNVLQGKIDPPA
jgi:hypothetical protein